MGHGQSSIGQSTEVRKIQTNGKHAHEEDFVLEKSIFSTIFEKDIRRVFIYKKAERLAKAIHLIAPAFAGSASLMNRIEAIAVGLIDAAILPPGAVRTMLSRELLALSSVLSLARTSNLLSAMNAELISHEAHMLLQEVAAYEEPRLSLGEAPTLSTLAKSALSRDVSEDQGLTKERKQNKLLGADKGHTIKDTNVVKDNKIKDRSDAILSVIRNKGNASIKDISTLIRGISEKTIQRELASLVHAGAVMKQGERRWSTYQLAG